MEYVIAIFVGVWIAAAGIISYVRIKKDYDLLENQSEKSEEPGVEEED